MLKNLQSVLVLASVVTLSACGGSADNSTTIIMKRTRDHAGTMAGSGNRRHEVSSSDIPATTKSLLAAAEPFETLTETAFNASRVERSKAIEAATYAVGGIRGIVPQSVSTELNRNMGAIGAADVADHPADLALASIENYRVLVSAVPGTPIVPVDVSLLDYAGFRFDADAQAAPARWDDMARALTFARQRWSSVASNAAVAKVAPRFEAALAAMDKAVHDKNIAHARAAAKIELDLVDVLEAAFEHADPTKA